MPTLEWIGKKQVINHHQDVPYRVLEHKYTCVGGGSTGKEAQDGNKIIKGDNLAALKSLLPQYEGKIRCIYIDPPYNTGNEGWVYNDNVNDPKIRKWLGEVVGKEGEDLSRHDKWLCMMYPRLKLLQKLLSNDGVVFISIDENEHRFLELLMDEIFGTMNRIETIIWQNNYGGGAKTKHIVHLHEYVLCFAKNIETVGPIELLPDDSMLKYYKYQDNKFSTRGPYRLQPLATVSMDARPNLRYPLYYEGNEVWPEKQWQWSQARALDAQENNELVFSQKNGKWTVNYKQYLKDTDGNEKKSKPYSIITGIYTQSGTKEIKAIMGDGKAFDFPKPPALIGRLLQMATDKDSIILDSFAGSGTTAHAVLNLNKQDGGNRKFILVEMEDYAETITAERVRRVIGGYADMEGTGGSFSFYELGEPLIFEDGNLNENVPIERIREYVFYMEAKCPLPKTPESAASRQSENSYYLGRHANTDYYFYYECDRITALDKPFLGTLGNQAEGYVIYADKCKISPEDLKKIDAVFKKIPRDIARL